MSVVIKTVVSKEDLKIFVKFPLQLYKDCPYYVPNLFADEMATLDPQRNAMGKYSLTRLFLAYKDGQMAGRIAAIINRIANTDWNHAEVRFGWAYFTRNAHIIERSALVRTPASLLFIVLSPLKHPHLSPRLFGSLHSS